MILTCIIACNMNINRNISIQYHHTKPKIIIIPLSFSNVRISTRIRKSTHSRDSSKLIIPMQLSSPTSLLTRAATLTIITTTTTKDFTSTKSRTLRHSAQSVAVQRISMAPVDHVFITSWWRVSCRANIVWKCECHCWHVKAFAVIGRKKGVSSIQTCKLVLWLFGPHFHNISISTLDSEVFRLYACVKRHIQKRSEIFCQTNDS